MMVSPGQTEEERGNFAADASRTDGQNQILGKKIKGKKSAKIRQKGEVLHQDSWAC